ncbi:hypothetical protein BSL78_04216 [Apostichopus japonicus]|uniref:Uncharacterized protein n=1 Tax=Stichopus japonicus TaxID=307972 RepID=A0A2G8LF71_STIJA|nr:hypothetical protein BSL78_04216 [Apostichopus japonicus]
MNTSGHTSQSSRQGYPRLRKIFIMFFKGAFVILPVVLAVLVARECFSYPLHAQCTIEWKFGVSCQNVSDKLQAQIKKWNGKEGCASGGERCLYKLTGVTKEQLTATHTTPNKGYIDDLTFKFTETTGATCSVEGHSTSEVIYAILDYGTNYCNLENLITGSQLDNVTGYTESTSDKVCTQYSSADCDKY